MTLTRCSVAPLFAMSLCVLLLSCGPTDEELALEGDIDLPLGEIPDSKADGSYGYATTCKKIPQLTPLASPSLTISLNGLTLHLKDATTGFSKVYPIGPGAIDRKSSSLTYNDSLSMYPLLAQNRSDFTIDTRTVDACRIWWKDTSTGQVLPVFAGLPFMSWSGSYGIHGPVTDYYLQSGGRLKRGFVSHGCIRMEGADVAELWAYIKGVTKVPVHVQKDIERKSDGTAVDVPSPFLLSECKADSDCAFKGGLCKANTLSGRGFCTVACDYTCEDRYGYPTTFCIKDPSSTTKGYCTYKASDFNYSCRMYDGFKLVKSEPRNGQPTVKADVCKPGSQGWIGDRCVSSSDCMTGNTCQKATGASYGYCTVTCQKYCPDKVGYASTFCVDGTCRARCESDAGCSAGSTCSTQKRYNQPTVTSKVCMPSSAS